MTIPDDPLIEKIFTHVLVAAISIYLTYHFGVSRDIRREKREAAKNLSRLIASEISALQRGERPYFSDFDQIFTAQDVAAIEFSDTLSFYKRFWFNRLWDEYKYTTSQKEAIQPMGAISYINHRKALKILKKIRNYT